MQQTRYAVARWCSAPTAFLSFRNALDMRKSLGTTYSSLDAFMNVFINGRFLGQPATGVQRYALETLLALDAILAKSAQPNVAFTLLAPRGVARPPLSAIAFANVGRLAGHAWEQLELPLAARAGWLLSFTPTGPLLKRRQTETIHEAAEYAMPHALPSQFRAW